MTQKQTSNLKLKILKNF